MARIGRGALNMLHAHTLTTPLGEMLAVFSAHGLCLLDFADRPRTAKELLQVQQARGATMSHDPVAPLEDLQQQMDAYFGGRRQAFDVRLDCVGTPFQQQVWQVLLRIPYGQTWSYLHEAQSLGNARAVRAVAAANGANKISIIIPCHRVIGSNGQLTGYGGGLERKRRLLALEAEHAADGA